VGTDGHAIGRVVDLLVDTSAMKVRQLLIAAGDTGQDSKADRSFIALDVDEVDLRPSTRDVLARSHAGRGFDRTAHLYAGAYDDATSTRQEERLTRTEEELAIGKREVSKGEVRVGKHVETERVSQPVTRRREEVVVERRPVEAGARGDAATIGDAEVRVPLMEEEVIVEKRPVVKEELVIGKRVVEEHDVVEAEVRREEFDIENDVDVNTTKRPASRDRR
jgi:uncharacterized protein (TIGR02271 family)